MQTKRFYIRGYNLFGCTHLYSKVESNLETCMFFCVNQVPVMLKKCQDNFTHDTRPQILFTIRMTILGI